MDALVKQAIKLGNSAGVILPKGWEYRKVKVELVEDSITRDVFDIIGENGLLSDVIGVYLAGSYAREEERPNSNIDILIVTEKTNKIVKRGNYELLFVSENSLDKNITRSLYIYSMIREAKVILNNSLIRKYKYEKFSSYKEIIKEINSMIKFNRESVGTAKEIQGKVLDGMAYSIVLRLRELFLLDCFLKDKNYSSRKFIEIIEKKASKEAYEAYLRIKNDLRPKNNVNPEDAEKLLDYSEELVRIIRDGKKTKKT